MKVRKSFYSSYLFILIFFNRNMYMGLITGKNTPSIAKEK